MLATSAVPIAIIGDMRPENSTHVATTASLVHAGAAIGVAVEPRWIGTDELAGGGLTSENLRHQIARYRGIWIAPGSP